MKKIYVSYDAMGYIENLSDDNVHYEQENMSLQIDASIATDKKVRAYIRASNNNSKVTDELVQTENLYSLVLDGEYMSKGTLYVGYELFDDTGYIERLEPLKIYIDSFVSLDNSNSDNVYVVTVKIGSVETLESGEEATVENVGTKKDMILNFGIPRGVQGEKGDKGDAGEQGADGYTPVKGVDYFTAEDIENMASVVEGKLKDLTFDGYIDVPAYETDIDIELENYTENGIYKVHFDYGDDHVYNILSVTVESVTGTRIFQTLICTDTGTIQRRIREEYVWSEWTTVSVSQTDLNEAIGNVEASLENIITKYGLDGDTV